MHLRAATPADVPALAGLGTDSFVDAFGTLYSPRDLAAFLNEHKTQAAFAAQLANPDSVFRLAEIDGMLGGYCKLGLSPGWPDQARGARVVSLHQLYVASRQTGRGVGAALMDWAFAEAATRAADEMQLSVWSGNHGAQRFYHRLGFTKIAEVTFRVGEQIDEEFLFAKRL